MSKDYSFTCRTAEETGALGRRLASVFNEGDCVTLSGPLGAGKTELARSIIRALCPDTPDMTVPSPTFTLLQQYETLKGLLWHYDLYRIEDPEEIYETGWEEAIGQDIVMIEWADKIEELLPADAIHINIRPKNEESDTRLIHLTAPRALEL